jgi:hypothetical protein
MNAAQGTQGIQQLGQGVRARAWDERSVEEKIELLRDLLRSKELMIRDIVEQVDALMDHRHDASTGQPVRRLWPSVTRPTGRSFDSLA